MSVDIQSPPSGRRRRTENDALVLAVLHDANRPLSAYDIVQIAALCAVRIVPNQVYRTLTRLVKRGLVRRIETLSAYVSYRGQADACLICTTCHSVTFVNLPGMDHVLLDVACGQQFVFADLLIEIQGRCVQCRTVP